MNLQPNFIKYSYPTSSYENINDDIKKEIDKFISDFYNAIPNQEIDNVEYYLDISYKTKPYNDYITYILYVSTFIGGESSDNKVVTFTYKKNKRIYFKDIIGNNIEKVSSYIKSELLTINAYPNEIIEHITTNDFNNYRRFSLEEKGINIIFNPYLVNYCSEIIELVVPYDIFE